jgi:ribonuclease BN (tRNA processing enzyme)
MKIKILGANNIESKDTKNACLLIDDVLAIDAGAITSTMTLKEQQQLKAVLLTHRHYDHIKDIPELGMNFYLMEKSLVIYAIRSVYEDISARILDDMLYPDFRKMPSEKPALIFSMLEAGREETIEGYKILPVTMIHSVPCVGFQVTSPSGKKIFYTSDTGPGLEQCWQKISPDLLIIEVTTPSKYHDFAVQAGHLTPALLKIELESFRKLKGYLPSVVTVHAKPMDEKKIQAELDEVARTMKIKVQFGRQGMVIKV